MCDLDVLKFVLEILCVKSNIIVECCVVDSEDIFCEAVHSFLLTLFNSG